MAPDTGSDDPEADLSAGLIDGNLHFCLHGRRKRASALQSRCILYRDISTVSKLLCGMKPTGKPQNRLREQSFSLPTPKGSRCEERRLPLFCGSRVVADCGSLAAGVWQTPGRMPAGVRQRSAYRNLPNKRPANARQNAGRSTAKTRQKLGKSPRMIEKCHNIFPVCAVPDAFTGGRLRIADLPDVMPGDSEIQRRSPSKGY